MSYDKEESQIYIVGSRGASQLGDSLLGILPGYKANKLIVSLSYPLGLMRTLVRRLDKHSLFHHEGLKCIKPVL